MDTNGNGPSERSPVSEGDSLRREATVISTLNADMAAAKSQIDDLNAQLGARDAKLGELQALLTERVGQVQHLEREQESLNEARQAADAEIATLTDSLGSQRVALETAITKYRDMLVIANPMIPPEMFSGDSIAEIDASIERAKGLVIKIRASLDEQARNTAIPAGAPERSSPDLSSLSPMEKIQYAIRKESK